MRELNRREFLGLTASAAACSLIDWPHAAAAATAPVWSQGQVAHLIPTASHERFLIKASFRAPLAGAPHLSVDGKSVAGVQTDAGGRFWRFDAPALQPARQYELRLLDPGGGPLC